MPINFSDLVYKPAQDIFGRKVMFTPLASQPGQPAYLGRGIFGTEPLDVAAEDGSIFSDQRTILDIRTDEFTVSPIQDDQITIPEDSGLAARGSFVVIDIKDSGGGEITLYLRKIVEAKPA